MHFDFVLGMKWTLPANVENLVYLKNSVPPDSTWSVAGIGLAQLYTNVQVILMGGHDRVGLEDNLYFRKGQLATNEQLVERIAKLSRELGREIANTDEARGVLHLNKSSRGVPPAGFA